MLKVDDYEKIKKTALHDGMSQREAAKTFKHGRDTIRKILPHATPPGYQRSNEPVQPVFFGVIPKGCACDNLRTAVLRVGVSRSGTCIHNPTNPA